MDSRRALRTGRTLSAAFDTNILVYATGLIGSSREEPKKAASRALYEKLVENGDRLVLPVQVLAETHRVLVQKGGLSRAQAARQIGVLAEDALLVATDQAVLEAGLELSGRHNVPTFDAIILAAAATARCDILYSEDFHAGFTWRGVEVVNPFG